MDVLRLFQSERGNLKRFLRRFGRSVSAEDVAQETFLQLLAAKPTNVAKPRAYLFAAARNVALLHLRRARGGVEIAAGVEVEGLAGAYGADNPEHTRIAREEIALLNQAIDQLPAQQRNALMLRRVEKLSPRQVAEKLGVTERQVQRLVAQAVSACHAHLDDNGDSDPVVD